MFSRVKLEGLLNEERIIIIFSGLASVFELSKLTKEMNINLPIYIDTFDEFDLLPFITNPKENPLIIDIKNYNGLKEDI